MEALRATASDLLESADVVSSSKSKIPRFKRSQSLRLKGEKFHPLLQQPRDVVAPSRNMSLTFSNLRVFETGKNIVDDRIMTKTSKSSSLINQMGLRNGSGDQSGIRSKRLVSTSCLSLKEIQKANSPSEYGSLPSTPVPSPDVEDSESVKSFHSYCSALSLDHAHHNSSLSAAAVFRRKKYVVHCQSHCHDEEEYLTPTQRKDRLIRQLKAMLLRARRELDEKDSEILRLTKEVIELKLFKSDGVNELAGVAALSTEVARETGSNRKSYEDLNHVFKSTRDSGHFEQSDGGSAISSSCDSGLLISTCCKDEATNTNIYEEVHGNARHNLATRSQTVVVGGHFEGDLEDFHKREIEEVKRHHSNEYQELKEKYNDRIENLLQKLSEANTRYFDLRPKYDRAQERIRMLEKQVELTESDVSDQDKRHHQMYLKMYKKGQEAARFEHADEVLEFAHKAPKRVSVPEILQQLQMTERELEHVKALYRREIYKHSDSMEQDPEITLKFLKDAIYYFLTDKDSRDHLRAIESIMGYSDSERLNIDRSLFSRSKLI